MKYKKGYQWSLSGLLIGLVIVAMATTGLATFLSSLQDEYSLSGENSLSKYGNITNELSDSSTQIDDALDITQEQGILDIIGAYFTSGYSALKTAWLSLDLFNNMVNDATGDVPALANYKVFIIMVITFGIFIGVGITVLVKWRV